MRITVRNALNVTIIALSALASALASVVTAQTRPAEEFYPRETSAAFMTQPPAAAAAVDKADADFNNDGAYGDERDVEDFLSVYGEGPCSTGDCDSIDVNRDGGYYDPDDQAAYLNWVRHGVSAKAMRLWRPARDEQGYALVPNPTAIGGRAVYVSTVSGDDADDGLTRETAVRTLLRGAQLLRNGTPDQLLLATGCEWDERLVTRDGSWTKGGAGPDRPMVIGWYAETPGRPQPRITYRGSNPQFASNAIQVMGDEFPGYLWIVGIEFRPREDASVAHSAVYLYTNKSHVAIEGCRSVGGNSFLIADGITPNGLNDLYVGRNSIERTKDAGGQHSGGGYIVRVGRALIDGNVLDVVGWDGVARTPDCKFNQGWYLVGNFETAADCVLFSNNLVFKPAHCAFQLRGQESYAWNNTVMYAPIGISGGHAMLPPGCYWTGGICGNTIFGWAACPGAAQGESVRYSRGDGAVVLKNEYVNPRLATYVEQPVGDVTDWGNVVRYTEEVSIGKQ